MPAAPRTLAPYVDRLEGLQREVLADRFLVSTGQKAAADPGPFRRHADLVDGRLARALLDEGHVAWARELIEHYFRAAMQTATDRLRKAERGLAVSFRGQPRGYSELTAMLRSSTGLAERVEVSEAITEILGPLAAERQRWVQEYHSARAALGFRDHSSFAGALYPGLAQWAAHAARWLDDTRADFLARWRGWRDRDGLTEPVLADLQAVGGRVHAPPGAPPAVAAARAGAAAMGFDAGQISVDTGIRPGKATMAFCTPVAPPGDVRLSVHAIPSMSALISTVHEFAHGLHFTTAPGRPADLWPVDPAITEGFGLTLELAALQSDWQRRHLGAELADEDVKRLVFARDSTRRIVAASIGYELAVLDGHADPPAEYARVFRRELDVGVSPLSAYGRLQSYLQGQPCYPLVYYQAFFLRDALWNYVSGIAGPHWHADPSAREPLTELFRHAAEADISQWMISIGCQLSGGAVVS